MTKLQDYYEDTFSVTFAEFPLELFQENDEVVLNKMQYWARKEGTSQIITSAKRDKIFKTLFSNSNYNYHGTI